MAFLHGKSAQVLHNEFDLSSYFKEISVSRMAETAETTAFGNSAKTYITGLTDGTLSLTGMFEGSSNGVDKEMTDVIGDNTGGIISISVSGATTIGTRMMSATGKLTAYEVSAPVADVVSITAQFQADSGIGNAISLHALGADTATANNTSVDNTTSSTNGGYATLHVTANTMNGTDIFKVQHSSDNSTWADLSTFSTVASTTVTAERKTVASGTTVNRYLRSTLTAAGTGSITYHINFARA